MEYDFLAVLPPLIAILLCFWTKQVVLSLFVGIYTGGVIIMGGNPLSGFEYTLDAMIKSITDSWNASLLLFSIFMGCGIAFVWKLGGSQALSAWAAKKIKSQRMAGVGIWIFGFIIFFNDCVNSAIVGNVSRDIAKAHRISTEKLSYLLDSTAAPIASLLLSDWVAFQIGMINTGLEAANIKDVSAFSAYLQTLPMNIYAILSIAFVGIVVISGKDFGAMWTAENRARNTGKLVRDGGQPLMDVGFELGEPFDTTPRLSNLFIPMLTLVGVTLFGFWWTGRAGDGIVDILAKCDPAKALLWGAFAMALSGFFLAIGRKIMTVGEAMDTLLNGMKLLLLACCILVLAWSLGGVIKDMKLADFIIKIIGNNIPFAIVPIIIFVFGMLISFATGTSWGTMTILTPVAIPLGYQMTGDVHTAIALAGVVLSGAIFGDHCSPISDTTVFSSIFAGADHIDHVSTQIPYAIAVAAVTGLLFVLYGFIQFSSIILLSLGFIALIILFFTIAKNPDQKVPATE
ncbi:MAG: sodium:proton antiporter [Desulfobulbus propionicus]|nr:MAG: sodium:proton antiporter [Desulfobulbus propionicus]